MTANRRDFLSLCLELQNHLFRNMAPSAHGDDEVRVPRAVRAHRCDVLTGERTELVQM